MARANRQTLCTKWLEMSDVMTDEEHAADDARLAAFRAQAKAETEAERRIRQRKMDTAILVGSQGNKPFSIFKQ